ncbi:AAA family ATPase [Herbiconiux sp. CPCC 205763]|uniref:AAA family ATPase n=1 Tax=Herbiconiux aconitum TaxID=2970913 RepID=A0ABT2GZD4_9MICO|nr:helix-turn-helix transcriptional regulator [Herbiconiux aconitum]MCS5720331.1 AAA family ATPase [Herbiconiux aconitum]
MLDRQFERTRLDDLLHRVREGQSSTLLLAGGPGVGKTELLRYLTAQAGALQILQVTGIQSEVELAYSALHQLCRPLMRSMPALPDPQREALETTFGIRAGATPDRLLVGLATLSLLAEAAASGPLVCVIDDAQWLDANSAQVLGFVARRLEAEGVGMVFAVRTDSELRGFDGVPRIDVGGLPMTEARRLLSSLAMVPIDPRALERILDEAEGNPLVLIETARAFSPAEIATGIILSSRPARPSELEAHFSRRLHALPSDTQQFLLLSAAEPFADAQTITAAASGLGLSPAVIAPAVAAELCEVGSTVRFRHPLIRSAVYRNASEDALRTAHAALAAVDAGGADTVSSAWHRALSVDGPDEDAARGLAAAADRLLLRGGPGASAELLRQALKITADEECTQEWLVRIVQREMLAGHFDNASRDATALGLRELSPRVRAEAKLAEARIEFARSRGGIAVPLLLDAAAQLADTEPQAAQEAFLEAMSGALFGGRLARVGTLGQVAAQWRAAGLPKGARPADELLGALSSVVIDGGSPAWESLHAALSTFRSAAEHSAKPVPWLWLACVAAAAAWDLESWDALSLRHVEISRHAGDYSELPIALSSRALVHLFAGDLDAAADTVREMATITSATGGDVSPYGAIGLAAMKGDDATLHQLIEGTIPTAEQRAEATGVAIACWGAALLDNSRGRYDSAADWARRAVALHHSLHSTTAWALVEWVEAAARSKRQPEAEAALAELEAVAGSSGTEWVKGVLARSRALVADPSDAERHHLEAIRRLQQSPSRFDHARSCLLYGEWLRRQKRLPESRAQLTKALEIFDSMGAAAFSARASGELSAAGALSRRSTTSAPSVLTTQEMQIARLASQGYTNAEMASRMFLSSRTVEHHLAKIFAKLQISSRHAIEAALGGLVA